MLSCPSLVLKLRCPKWDDGCGSALLKMLKFDFDAVGYLLCGSQSGT
ncbi:MAG: hypothetical protein ACKESB_02495 [Candidatus Hodgkinia cicadicola]